MPGPQHGSVFCRREILVRKVLQDLASSCTSSSNRIARAVCRSHAESQGVGRRAMTLPLQLRCNRNPACAEANGSHGHSPQWVLSVLD